MNLKTDNRGVTLIELMIAVSLLSIILSGAYYLLTFSANSLKNTEAQFIAEEDARKAILSMENDIRKARSVVFGGTSHKAAEVYEDGMRLNVYTDTDQDGALEEIQYKLFGNVLKRGEAELGASPVWNVIAGKVKNNLLTTKVKIFTVSSETVNVNLIITDDKDCLADDPVTVAASITVRSKEAMD